jgi:hypothetical protein
VDTQYEFDFVASEGPERGIAVDILRAQSENLDRISQLVANPGVSMADISRLIALQIANVIQIMRYSPVRSRIPQRHLNEQVKAYRELQKTLVESDGLSKRDILNLDGLKFKFIFKEVISLFKQALKDAGADDQLAQNVMLQFGDLVKTNDENLQHELNRIEMQ